MLLHEDDVRKKTSFDFFRENLTLSLRLRSVSTWPFHPRLWSLKFWNLQSCFQDDLWTFSYLEGLGNTFEERAYGINPEKNTGVSNSAL